MHAALVVSLVLGLSAPPAKAQQPSQPGFWKGKFEIFQFNFSDGTNGDRVKSADSVSRGADLWKSDYDLYLNREGIAREELTHMNRNRSVEGPLDINLLDYNSGYHWVWDKGGRQAIKEPLNPPVEGKPIGSRRILGFACEGTEYQWTTFQQAKVELQSWSARDSNFRVPLLQVQSFTDRTGALLTLRIQVVTHLEPVSDLPPSLFELPAGLRVVSFPLTE